MMDTSFKDQLAVFLQDMRAICYANLRFCSKCPLRDTEFGCCSMVSMLNGRFDVDKIIETVEAYRKIHCVADRVVDTYTYEVVLERDRGCRWDSTAAEAAEGGARELVLYYGGIHTPDVRILSAKRNVMESNNDAE